MKANCYVSLFRNPEKGFPITLQSKQFRQFHFHKSTSLSTENKPWSFYLFYHQYIAPPPFATNQSIEKIQQFVQLPREKDWKIIEGTEQSTKLHEKRQLCLTNRAVFSAKISSLWRLWRARTLISLILRKRSFKKTSTKRIWTALKPAIKTKNRYYCKVPFPRNIFYYPFIYTMYKYPRWSFYGKQRLLL